MTTTSTSPPGTDTSGADQRGALDAAEQRATESQPGSYKPAESGEKQVQVPPIDADGMPIQGLDNAGR